VESPVSGNAAHMPETSDQQLSGDAVTPTRHRVAVIGGGFGGLYAARALADADVSVTLIDRVNHHLFQPLLYQVATGILSEGEIAPALRGVLRHQDNIKVLLAEVTAFDLRTNRLTAIEPDGRELTLAFDSLIVAAGMTPSYFGHDEWREVAPGLKTLDDARWLRSHILGAFEMAELARTPEERAAWLTFVVVGAGPTGVELTGEIATLARGVLPRDFRDIATLETRVVLIDATPSVLPTFPESLRRRAAADLRGFGVEIRTGTAAAAIDANGIDITNPDGTVERITARTVCWAAGMRAASAACWSSPISRCPVTRRCS
jgi:NADH dehydrogenase